MTPEPAPSPAVASDAGPARIRITGSGGVVIEAERWEDILGARAAAQEAGVEVGVIYRALKAGRLKGRNMGRVWFIVRPDLAAWMEEREPGQK